MLLSTALTDRLTVRHFRTIFTVLDWIRIRVTLWEVIHDSLLAAKLLENKRT